MLAEPPPKMGKGGILKTSKLLKVKAKAKCVAKAKAKAKALAATRSLKGAQKKAQPKGQSSKPLKGVLKPTKKNLKKLGREASLVEKVQALKRSQRRRGGGVAGPGRPQQARQEQVVEPAPDPHEQQPRGQGAAGEAGQESLGCSGDTVVPSSRQSATVRELLRKQGGGHDLEKGRQVVVGEGSFGQMDRGRA